MIILFALIYCAKITKLINWFVSSIASTCLAMEVIMHLHFSWPNGFITFILGRKNNILSVIWPLNKNSFGWNIYNNIFSIFKKWCIDLSFPCQKCNWWILQRCNLKFFTKCLISKLDACVVDEYLEIFNAMQSVFLILPINIQLLMSFIPVWRKTFLKNVIIIRSCGECCGVDVEECLKIGYYWQRIEFAESVKKLLKMLLINYFIIYDKNLVWWETLFV